MFEGFARKKVDVGGGVTINCVVGGEGPPVLLLHGMPQCLAMWAKVAPQLTKKYTVVCADLRGYGDSSKPKNAADNANYAFRVMALDQVRLMETLGHKHFHLVGHDRGARTSYRMALDHPGVIQTLAVLDIVPTYAMFRDTDRHSARMYWHWFFLTLPEPFPEHMIGKDPDYVYEVMLTSWGGAKITDFRADQLAEYRRCWRDPGMIHGSSSDYRAGATVDRDMDVADLEAGKKITCPTLAWWGEDGAPGKRFDVAAEWKKFCPNLTTRTIPGGHFFIDHRPDETARGLLEWLP
jgi:haloacetate dehalogenase